jgi:hypothetical protein
MPEYQTYILPEWLKDYLIDGNADVFTEGEKESVDKFLIDNNLGECVEVSPVDDYDPWEVSHELDRAVFAPNYWSMNFKFKTLK